MATAGRSASSRCRRPSRLLHGCCGASPASCSRPRATSPRSTRLIADLERAETALTPRVAGKRATAHRHRARPRDGRVYLDHARDIGAYNPSFPEYELAVDGDRAAGTVTFPLAVRGPAGHRARRVPRGVLRLRGAAPQLRRRRGRQDDLAHAPVPAPDAAAHARSRSTIERRVDGDRIRSTARLLLDDDACCARPTSTPSPATAAQPARGLAPPEHRRDAPTWSTPATACRSPSPRSCGPAPASGRTTCCSSATTTSLTYGEADRRSAELARALLAAGAGPGHPRRAPAPERPRVRRRVAGRGAHRRGQRAAEHVLDQRRAASRCCAAPTSSVLLAAVRLPRRRTTGRACRPGSPSSTSPRRRRCSPPASRRCAASRSPVPGPTSMPDWTMAGLLAHAGGVGDDVLAAAEAAVTPADRMVIVHTSGSTSDAEGRDPRPRRRCIRHLDNLNQLRRYDAGRGAVLELAVLLDRRLRLRAARHAARGRHARLLERHRRRGGARRARAGAADDGERLRGRRSRTCREDPTFPARDLSSIRRGNLWPIMPAAVRPRDPELRHAMLGMTEAGSVCLAERRRVASSPSTGGARSAGRSRASRPRSRPEADGAACAPGEVGELWFRGPFLMEGYDGRERHETFDRDGWYRTGDLFTRRRRRLLLLPRAAAAT